MARREYTLTRRCAHEGCRESIFYIYSTKADYSEAANRYHNKNWWCSRHNPNRDNVTQKTGTRTVEKTITAVPSDIPVLKGKNFWDTGSGFAFGDHWNAYAEDFPAGAQIIVTTTVKVLLPE